MLFINGLECVYNLHEVIVGGKWKLSSSLKASDTVCVLKEWSKRVWAYQQFVSFPGGLLHKNAGSSMWCRINTLLMQLLSCFCPPSHFLTVTLFLILEPTHPFGVAIRLGFFVFFVNGLILPPLFYHLFYYRGDVSQDRILQSCAL